MKEFDIIRYLDSRTGYTFAEGVLERIAMERGVAGVTDFAMLDERDRDLTLADMLMVIYTTPTQTASLTKEHGAWKQQIGSQTITDKRHIYELMMSLYRKWDDPMADMVDAGGVGWIIDD